VIGSIQADQAISFQAMRLKLAQLQAIVQATGDRQRQRYTGSGGGQTNSGMVYIDLKPIAERSDTADQVIARLRSKLTQVPGARLYLQSVQDIRIGGRMSNASTNTPCRVRARANSMRSCASRRRLAKQYRGRGCQFRQQQTGLETDIVVDRDTASRLAWS